MPALLDSNTEEILTQLYPGFSDQIKKLITQIQTLYSLPIRLTAGFRTIKEQQDLFDQGRTTPGPKVTDAQPWQSFHSYGLAVDICFRGKDPYLQFHPKGNSIWGGVGVLGEKMGLSWGGKFQRFNKIKNEWSPSPDRPHFENTYGLSWQSCQLLCEDDGLGFLWKALDQKRGVAPGYGWSRVPALYKE